MHADSRDILPGAVIVLGALLCLGVMDRWLLPLLRDFGDERNEAMKCPKCDSGMVSIGESVTALCGNCAMTWRTPAVPRCPHEPANFSKTGTATYYDPGSAVGITFPYHVCRLCGVFYTDLEAVAAGEKKYEESQ